MLINDKGTPGARALFLRFVGVLSFIVMDDNNAKHYNIIRNTFGYFAKKKNITLIFFQQKRNSKIFPCYISGLFGFHSGNIAKSNVAKIFETREIRTGNDWKLRNG